MTNGDGFIATIDAGTYLPDWKKMYIYSYSWSPCNGADVEHSPDDGSV